MNQEFNPSHLARLDRLRGFARLLDAAVAVPGTNFRVGLDALLGLVPGLGDAVAAAFGGYLICEAIQLGAPKATILRMAGNLGIDLLAGTVPVLGDLADAAWRSNLRNVDLLAAHLASLERAGEAPAPPRSLVKRWGRRLRTRIGSAQG